MRRRLVLALTTLLSGAQAPPTATDLEAYRAELASIAREGSWWRTPNAEYAAADGGAEAYGTRFWLELGGVSAGGCLWSIRDGEVEAVHWHFFQGWDGARGRPFFYQTHATGSTGMGEETYRRGSVTAMEQDFWWSDGTRERTIHRTEWLDPDRYVTSSEVLAEGRWTPRRTYTWSRQATGTPPCGPAR